TVRGSGWDRPHTDRAGEGADSRKRPLPTENWRDAERFSGEEAIKEEALTKEECTMCRLAFRLKLARMALLSAFCLLLFVAPAFAQAGKPVRPADIGFEQRLDEQVPLDLNFRDETERTVRLGDYFSGRPVILALVYYECPLLCNQVLTGLTHS